MNSLVTLARSGLLTITLVACGGGATPTAPRDGATVATDSQSLDAVGADTLPTDSPSMDATQDSQALRDTTIAVDRRAPMLACTADSVCVAPATCDRSAQLYVRGLCTRTCTNPHASAVEQSAACAISGSTCLGVGFFSGRCLAACDPRATDSCPLGQACSALWFDPPGTAPDDPACVRFCTSDEHCVGDPAGPHCRRRLGVCDRQADDVSLLADGSPCNPLGLAQCRGFCLEAVDTEASHGLCASLILRSIGDSCPDDPARVAVRGAAAPDHIGMCAFRACARNCDCPMGLLCLHEKDAGGMPTTGPRYCRYPSVQQPSGIPCE